MKKTVLLVAGLIAGMIFTADLFGQAQIYTRKEKLKDITAKTTKVVLTGDEMFDEAFKESVSTSWNIAPFEFCTKAEFDQNKGSDKFYFLLVVKGQQKKEAEPGIDLLTLVKGGEGAQKGVGDMLEVVSFPLRSASEPSGREFVFLPAFLSIMQAHALNLLSSEVKAYSQLSATETKNLGKKRLYLNREDFAPQVESKVIDSLDEDTIVVDDEEEADTVFNEGTFNTVVSYVVAPSEPVDGSVCYKMLIGSDDHRLYWFKKHRISARQGAGFLTSDLKAINLIRK